MKYLDAIMINNMKDDELTMEIYDCLNVHIFYNHVFENLLKKAGYETDFNMIIDSDSSKPNCMSYTITIDHKLRKISDIVKDLLKSRNSSFVNRHEALENKKNEKEKHILEISKFLNNDTNYHSMVAWELRDYLIKHENDPIDDEFLDIIKKAGYEIKDNIILCEYEHLCVGGSKIKIKDEYVNTKILINKMIDLKNQIIKIYEDNQQ